MFDAHEFLRTLTIVLGVGAVTAVVFHHLRQPVVLGYLIAGTLVGPHLHLSHTLAAHEATVRTLSELGVILVMFSLGLEFSLQKLTRVGPQAAFIAVVECGLMAAFGYSAADLLGWTPVECLFAGALCAISSTTIIAKVLGQERRAGDVYTDTVFGILIVEDLIAILLLAVLTPISLGGGLSLGELGITVGRLAGFLALLLAGGLLVVPRATRALIQLQRHEVTLVGGIAICFVFALLAHSAGYSVALGAFIAGSLVAEAGHGPEVEKLVHPVRDMFAAIFFVSVGMLIQPQLLATHWLPVLVFTGVVVLGKVMGASLGTFLTGQSVGTSIKVGMTLAQIGEFSFIIAGVGLANRGTRDFLYPVAVAVSAITTLLTPVLVKRAPALASYVDRKLPRPVQTVVSLYGAWMEALRKSGERTGEWARVRRLLRVLVVDVVGVAAVVIGTSSTLGFVVEKLRAHLSVPPALGRALMIGGALALCAPLVLGAVRSVRALGDAVARLALPTPESGVDLASAPRRVLVTLTEAGLVLVLGAPLVSVLQHFLPAGAGLAALVAVLGIMGAIFWKRANNLQGHVRAGSQAVVEFLIRQARSEIPASVAREAPPEAALHRLLPGLGDPSAVQLSEACFAVGRTLAQLNVRALTGATVLAITRGNEGLPPRSTFVLAAGDVLALAGTQDSVEVATRLLVTGVAPGGAAEALLRTSPTGS